MHQITLLLAKYFHLYSNVNIKRQVFVELRCCTESVPVRIVSNESFKQINKQMSKTCWHHRFSNSTFQLFHKWQSWVLCRTIFNGVCSSVGSSVCGVRVSRKLPYSVYKERICHLVFFLLLRHLRFTTIRILRWIWGEWWALLMNFVTT